MVIRLIDKNKESITVLLNTLNFFITSNLEKNCAIWRFECGIVKVMSWRYLFLKIDYSYAHL